MNMLEFFNAETLWPYVTGEKDIPRNNQNDIVYYRSARDFGRLCAITSLQKGFTTQSNRPIDYEFVDIYNGITKAILATLEMGIPMSMTKLRILAEYIGPKFVHQQDYNQGLDVVLKGDISNVYIEDENIVSEEHRKRIISMFGGCLKTFNSYYGLEETKKIINVSNQAEALYDKKL